MDLPDYKFFTDPKTVQPPEPGPDYTMEALKIENKKADNEAQDEDRKASLEQERIALDRYKAELAAQVDIAIANGKGEGMVQLEQVRAALRDRPMLEQNEEIVETKAAVQQLTNNLGDTIAELKKAVDMIGAERELVRDPQGKPIGTKLKVVR